MYEIHIYVNVDSASTRKTKKRHAYKLVWKQEVREGSGEIEGTFHEATLKALIEAMGRLTQSCKVHIHTADHFVLNMIDTNLTKWAGNGFLTSKGEPVQSKELWQELWRLTKGQLIITEREEKEYV